ncbi:MAG: TraR/DksA C4-type zinc finger protein [Candidatus Kerfeldbacteria bacterium]
MEDKGPTDGPIGPRIDPLQIAKSLRISGTRSHNDDASEMTVPDEAVKISLLEATNRNTIQQELDKNCHKKWDEITCTKCGCEIPLARRQAVAGVTRCVVCQSLLE